MFCYVNRSFLQIQNTENEVFAKGCSVVKVKADSQLTENLPFTFKIFRRKSFAPHFIRRVKFFFKNPTPVGVSILQIFYGTRFLFTTIVLNFGSQKYLQILKMFLFFLDSSSCQGQKSTELRLSFQFDLSVFWQIVLSSFFILSLLTAYAV